MHGHWLLWTGIRGIVVMRKGAAVWLFFRTHYAPFIVSSLTFMRHCHAITIPASKHAELTYAIYIRNGFSIASRCSKLNVKNRKTLVTVAGRRARAYAFSPRLYTQPHRNSSPAIDNEFQMSFNFIWCEHTVNGNGRRHRDARKKW